MVHLTQFCVILFSILELSVGNKLPKTFQKCSRKQPDFDKCLVKAVENAVGQLTKPFREVALPSIDPYEVPSMTIEPGSGPARFQQNFKNLKVTGFSKGKFSKFQIDFETKIINFECSFPKLVYEFEYDFNGTILVMPLSGHGHGSAIFENMEYFFKIQLEEYTKNFLKYFKIVGSDLEMLPHTIKFNFGNLFEGDENLSEMINQVFSENSKDVFADVKKSYEDAFGQIFTNIFDKFLEKVPIVDLFD